MKRITFIFFACSFLFAACEKEETEIPKIQTEYFPNSVGMYWKYERFDSTTSVIDTITVSIIGDTMVSNETYKIWKYDYGESVQRRYVIQNNDSVKFFRSDLTIAEDLYIVPFELGHSWDNLLYSEDTSYVSGIENIVLNGITYEGAAAIERNATSWNISLQKKAWIKSQIGLLKLEKHHYVIGIFEKETWELIETNIL
jgi:hypothetical protein